MIILNILFGLLFGFFIAQVVSEQINSYNNFIEIKTESLVVTSYYTKKALNYSGFQITKHITTFVYKGKNITTDDDQCYSRAVVGEKMNVKMKLWYKNGKLRKFKIIGF